MYPRDAITLYLSTSTIGNFTVIPATTTPYTILYSQIYSSIVSEHRLLVGSTVINRAGIGGSFNEVNSNYFFNNQAVVFSNPSNGTTSVTLTYVPRDRSITADPVQNIATSTNIFATSTSILNWQFGTSTTFLNSVLGVNCLSGCTGTSSNATTSITVNQASTTYMDASTTQVFNNNLQMQNTALSIGLYILIIYSVYWLIRKLF